MSKEYVESKIREALVLTSGNITKARQQVMHWAQADEALLQGLVRPHLDGIVSYQVERVASGRASVENESSVKQPQRPNQPQKKEEDFGMELLRAVAARSVPVFGLEGSNAPNKRKGASKQHVDAIHKIAAGRHNQVEKDPYKK